MFRLTSLAAVLAMMALAACARPTPYQAAAEHGGFGYSEQSIGEDQYRIGFNGNAISNRKTLDLYLLYRAAELTRDRGFDYFIVGRREEYIDPQGLAGRQSQISFVRRQELLIGSGIRARFGEEIVDQYGMEIDILMQKGVKPSSANVHGVEEILTDAEPAIIRPKKPS
ncbi:MAG: CC0125/CC1285 family lipoprotein [Geminicoccaceae bacterium]